MKLTKALRIAAVIVLRLAESLAQSALNDEREDNDELARAVIEAAQAARGLIEEPDGGA